MTTKPDGRVEPYSLISDHIKTGRFQWLDIIMQRWAYLLETTLFDTLGVLFEVIPTPVEWIQFGTFHKELKEQLPIYLFEAAKHGNGLFLVDNKFAQSCIQPHPKKRLKPQPASVPPLNDENQERLFQVLRLILKDFEKSWVGVTEMSISLTKVTTHPFRAKVMRPFEKCVVAKQTFRAHGFTTHVTLCFPYITLDPILQRLESKKVLPPETLDHYYPEIGEHFKRLLLQSDYEVVAELGTLELGAGHHNQPLSVGQILPVHSLVGREITLCINGTPLLTGEIGSSEDNYAIRVLGSYEEKKIAYRKRQRKFQSVNWPSAK